MSSKSESGHAKNVGNFEIVVSACEGQGTLYQPSNSILLLTALETLKKSAKEKMAQTNSALAAYSRLTGERATAFKPLNKLLTRVRNSLKSSGVTTDILTEASSTIRKIKGGRVTPKLTAKEREALTAAGKEQLQISTAQLSFDNRINNFDLLIKQIETVEQYKPNEADLKPEALKVLYSELEAINAKAKKAGIDLTNAREERDKVLYAATSGLVDVALDVKSYFVSVFGSGSSQYKQISKLRFKRRK